MNERVKELIESINQLTPEWEKRELSHSEISDGVQLDDGRWAIVSKLNLSDEFAHHLDFDGDGYYREKFDTVEFLIQELEYREYQLLVKKLRKEIVEKAEALEANPEGEKIISTMFYEKLYKRYCFTKDLNKAVQLADDYSDYWWSLHSSEDGFEVNIGNFSMTDYSPALAICRAMYANELWNRANKPEKKEPVPRKPLTEILNDLHKSIFDGMLENSLNAAKQHLAENMPAPDALIIPYYFDDENDEIEPSSLN
jgi:hypothetical protein